MAEKKKIGKNKRPEDVVRATAVAILPAQVKAAKTVDELKAVIVVLLKRLGMG